MAKTSAQSSSQSKKRRNQDTKLKKTLKRVREMHAESSPEADLKAFWKVLAQEELNTKGARYALNIVLFGDKDITKEERQKISDELTKEEHREMDARRQYLVKEYERLCDIEATPEMIQKLADEAEKNSSKFSHKELMVSIESKLPLFKGQTNHLIGEEEKQRILNKFDLSEVNPNLRPKILESLTVMMQYPTGREQLRQICNFPKSKFKIISNAQGNQECAKTGYKAFNEKDRTVLSTQLVSSHSLQKLGNILLHEVLHDRTSHAVGSLSFVQADMVTFALNAQLLSENAVLKDVNKSSFINTYHDYFDVAYLESYKKNVEKWSKIMEKGGKGRPKWAPAFEPAAGLTKEQLQEAKNAYIQQMSAIQTRSEYMEDFMCSHAGMNEKSSMPVRSYAGLATSIWYDSIDARYNGGYVRELSPKAQEYLHKQYPALDMKKMVQRSKEYAQEYEKGKGRKLRMEHTNVSEEFEKNSCYQRVKNALCEDGLSDEECIEKAIGIVSKSSLSTKAKLYQMSHFIGVHKNMFPETSGEHYEKRKKMIDKMKQVTGFKGFEYVGIPHGCNETLQKNSNVPEYGSEMTTQQNEGTLARFGSKIEMNEADNNISETTYQKSDADRMA